MLFKRYLQEYSRETVSAYPLSSFTPLSSTSEPAADSNIVPTIAPSIPPFDTLPPPISAQSYIWISPLSRLEPAIWEYSDFVRDNAWKWVGDATEGSQTYAEVDKRREMNGKIVRTEIVTELGEGEGRNVLVEVKE